MSWSSAGLGILPGRSGEEWTVADAAWLLDVPAREIREALRAGGTTPVGKRFDRGRGTRHVRVYAAEDVLRVLGLAENKFSAA
jgi:hypothetical protein